ncbi:MAG: ABC transporter permease [Puniceicoccales bacterium]
MMKSASTTPPPPAASIRWDSSEGQARILLAGPFTIHGSTPKMPSLSEALASSPKTVQIDGSEVTEWDSALILCLSRISKELAAQGVQTDIVGLSDSITPLLARAEIVFGNDPATTPAEKESLFIRLGEKGLAAYGGFRDFLSFLGETALSVNRLIRGKAIYQKADLISLLWENTGRSIGIVFLISFLTGLILAFVGAIQLSKFGADLFVADLVSIAMFREMGAMMTGVILAGRTGSAFAAQIGSMKANDELNALQTMGVSAFDFIVLPRLVTLSVMMPVLAFLASLSGIFGGMIVSLGFMDLSATQFLTQTSNSISMASFLSGTGKSIVFGAIIAMTGCFRGMAAGSSAESVGSAATSSVVTSIVLIIIADALFAVLFNIYGI